MNGNSLNIKIESSGETELPGVSFFNSNEFIDSRSYEGRTYKCFLLSNNAIPIIKLNLFIHDDSALSFFESTYGSIEISGDVLIVDQNKIEAFLIEIISFLRENGVKTLTITQYPDLYFTYAEAVIIALLKAGFEQIYQDLNQCILIDENSFYDRLRKSGKHKKINKCRKRGFNASLATIEDLEYCYQLMSRSRAPKGFKLSMSLEGLKKMFQKHPDHYYLFVAKDKDKIIASVVAISVSDEIFYTFYYGADLDYNEVSPTVFLLEYVYQFAQKEGFILIDLGRTSIDEVLNRGVQSFKESLDSVQTFKRKFYIEI